MLSNKNRKLSSLRNEFVQRTLAHFVGGALLAAAELASGWLIGALAPVLGN